MQIAPHKSSFHHVPDETSWMRAEEMLAHIRPSEVEKALKCEGAGSAKDFLALVSPAARPYLEDMAKIAQTLTRKRFGNTVGIFMPMYLANYCSNICTYCGFSYDNPIARIALSDKQIDREVSAIKAKGIRQLLLLTGEDHRHSAMPYFRMAIPRIRKHFDELTLEVQPLETPEYKEVHSLGIDGVYAYQETYRKKNYKLYHPKGKKSNFFYRLDCPQRAGEAGMHKIGLGVLLGLEDWRIDSYFCMLHLQFLKKKFWKSRFSISFPRLRPAKGVLFSDKMRQQFPNERDLAQLILAYRIVDEDLLLTLSTRERSIFRDTIVPLGITSISAESKTNPGGYACFPEKGQSLEQFEINDERPLSEVQLALRQKGIDPVMKDWMPQLSGASA